MHLAEMGNIPGGLWFTGKIRYYIGVFETVAGQAYTHPSPNGCPSMSMFLFFIVVYLE
jgi:hypothetical protein